ncbi:ionotropic receptor 21a [Glossina fuscipes]|uniref:Ionotropic receptor 21a n=1 Tax=Glossina fuscipes TaxID=7396 RepID=A0A9C5Z0N6_9MUSC|nr:ionotropic receptor 21a [Glossina fuscipes]
MATAGQLGNGLLEQSLQGRKFRGSSYDMSSTHVRKDGVRRWPVQLYLHETTICLIWNPKVEFQLNISHINNYAIINIGLKSLELTFDEDIVNFSEQRQQFSENDLKFNALTEKLTMSIKKSHCESFIAFENDILPFVEAFLNASIYSVWRSKRNRFVFGIQNENLCKHKFFREQSGVLLVEQSRIDLQIFYLKTNKFQGLQSKASASFYELDTFNASSGKFIYKNNLFPDKIKNLQGREIVVTGFDYLPYSSVKYVSDENNSYDLAFGSNSSGAVLIDGTEIRTILTFCELYNCRVLVDSTEADDWGEVYPNISGEGSLGMVIKGAADISVGAMYSWDIDYIFLDMSMYLVRSGITLLTPAPRRLASWLLPLEPFQYNLWLAIIIYLILEMLALIFMYKFENTVVGRSRSWYQNFQFGYSTTLKLFVSQAGIECVQSITLRGLLFTYFLNDIIITSIYGGGLASILTIPSYEEAADTVERLRSHNLKWTANSLGWVYGIRNADDELTMAIMKNFHLYNDEQIAEMSQNRLDMGFTLERLPFGHYAIGDYLSSKSIENLRIMKEDLYFQYTVAFTKRLWPMLDRFDQLIYNWHSAGLDIYWELRIVANTMDLKKQKQIESMMYSNIDDMGPIKLSMSNFAGILLIWVLGIAIAIMVFLLELIMKFYENKKLSLNEVEKNR